VCVCIARESYLEVNYRKENRDEPLGAIHGDRFLSFSLSLSSPPLPLFR